tara:strand:+ start:1534 stop:1953 length:420 start_codon:yes stop_codon:yes gene_type:complete
MTVIDWINSILIYKKPWEEFSEAHQKTFSPYIINRFLSMDPEFTEIINMFQPYSIGMLESKDIYKFYCKLLPKGKRFNKYIKGKKDKKYDPELIDLLCKYFEESKSHVLDYLELINKEQLKSILQLYGVEPKKVRKYIK